MFGLSGRRIGEVKTLKWQNIDFKNNIYTIEDTKNNETQQYQIPNILIDSLKKLKNETKNYKYVFTSPIDSNTHIKNVDRQVKKIKQYLKMPNYTFHLSRNILVSHLSEEEVEAIILSGILGHKNANSINIYLSQNYKKASKKLNEIYDKNQIDYIKQENNTIRELIKMKNETKDENQKKLYSELIKNEFKKHNLI